MIFVQGFKYIVDVYLNVANSAIPLSGASSGLLSRSFRLPCITIRVFHGQQVYWRLSLWLWLLFPFFFIFMVLGSGRFRIL